MTEQVLPPKMEAGGQRKEKSFRPGGLPFPAWWLAAAAVGVLLLLYYPIGMAVVHVIDDSPDFQPGEVAAGQSRAVAMAEQLIRREVDVHRWTPNDPFFQPSWALDNMPRFQQGIVATLSRFTSAMSEALARSGGDADMDRAAGLLKYPGTVWMFDPSTSWAPTASAEKQYRAAARALERYNQRLGGGEAVFERGAEAARAALEWIAHDLDGMAAALERHIAENRWAFADTTADDVFYDVKGRLYAYGLLLRELGWDHAQGLEEREAGAAWRRMQEAVTAAAALDPPVVVNGAPDAAILPSHLASQGFLLMRARAHMAEVAGLLSR